MVVQSMGKQTSHTGQGREAWALGVTEPGSDPTHRPASYGNVSRGPELPQKWGWLAAQRTQRTQCRAWTKCSINVSRLYYSVAPQEEQKGPAYGGLPCGPSVLPTIRKCWMLAQRREESPWCCKWSCVVTLAVSIAEREAESLRCRPETNMTLCVGYIQI